MKQSAIFLQSNNLNTNDLERESTALTRLFQNQDEVFLRMRQQQQDVNEALKKQQNLRRQVEHMQDLDKTLKTAEEMEASHLAKRAHLRGIISKIDDEVFDLRTKQINSINEVHGQSVFLTLQTQGPSSSYTNRLTSLLKKSSIRSQDEVAEQLATTFSPEALIDIIESGNSQKLAAMTGRDSAQMARVIAHLNDHVDLYQLEAEAPAARLDITMYDNGKAKPVETLSKGQKATAMLPLILRPLPYPLILDQPEDDLDNSFIIGSLVSAIKDLKLERQLIFVTHNANIPVLGDADQVVVMRMDDSNHAGAPKCGSVDQCRQEILDLLEGGAHAFAERETRYRDLLKGYSGLSTKDG